MTDNPLLRLALLRLARHSVLAFGLLIAPIAVRHASAQGIGSGAAKPVVGTAKDEAPNPADSPPPAIPGAASSPDLVVPAGKNAGELMPNEALFDGITRGDLPAARDAINRGADLNAHNVLGQTPLDSAIDLNRNDITFLLLSMRPSVNTPGGSDNGQAAAQAAAPQGRLAAARPAKPLKVTRTKTVRAAPARAPAAPRQFAGDGGTPNPEVGFVGFGQSR